MQNKLHATCLLVALLTYSVNAVLNNEIKRRNGFDTYGPPPRPAPQYGPPPTPQHLPHREYGVPQKIPFREYGPPSLKYGPPKFFNNGGGNGFSSNNFNGGIHEQIKSYFGVPKPFYGPPHIQHRPAGSYGPPPPPPLPQPQAQYGPPPPPHRPQTNYGPPPPRPSYGPPPQPLPSPHPAPIFRPPHQPSTSYGPPPSGPINLPPKQIYGPPPQNYGPPPLPSELPGQQPANFNRVPETTIILTNGGGGAGQGGGGYDGGHSGGNGGGHSGGHGGGHHGGPIKQVQIQIDAAGHTHSISGSQAPFHTACDGWKPIPAPVGAYVEHNHIDTQSGYSQVAQGFGTQYNAGTSVGGGGGGANTIIHSSGSSGGSGGGSIVDSLTDEQLVAIALQSGGFDGSNNGPGPGPGPIPAPPLAPSGPVEQHNLNSIESNDLQISLAATDDSYSRPPQDSYAPGSVHEQRYNTIGGSEGNYLPPPPPPSATIFVEQHNQQQQQQQQQQQTGLALQYGTQSGNLAPFPSHGGAPPSKPVVFRPPVPQGLLESIGATVQHLDQFGVKPQSQPDQTYIPPATNEIAANGLGNVGPEYGAPPAIIQQQLPQPNPPQVFLQHQQQQNGGNVGNQYLPPLQPPQQQYLPPPPPGRPLPPPPSEYLPPFPGGGVSFQQSNTDFEHSYSESQHNQQFVHAQALPLQQEPRFNQVVHDCGQGPNLVGTGYQLQQQQQQQQQHQHYQQHYQQQQQQQQQQQHYTSSTSANAYNAITQSIPIAEQHTQFIAGGQDSYAPPPSGNEIDHEGYASQKSSVATLPDGSDPQNLPGLDGLNVISAHKSHSIHLTQDNLDEQNQRAAASQQSYELQLGSSTNQVNIDDAANHEEILSPGLLHTILTAIEQPQSKHDEKQQQDQQIQAPNHRYSTTAQNRSDVDLEDDATAELNENEEEPSVAESNKVETKIVFNNDDEETAIVQEIKPIVAADIDEVQDEQNERH